MPSAKADGQSYWLRVVDGHIVQRGTGDRWRHQDDVSEGPVEGRALVLLPPHVTTLHWIACPDMTIKQGAAAAQVIARETSLAGAEGHLHAVAVPASDPSEPHIVAVASQSAMRHWVDWCVGRGLDKAELTPSALILPAPTAGFVRGEIGPTTVVRGVDTAFSADEPAAALLMGEEPCLDMNSEEVDALLLVALDEPPMDLKQGEFAPVAGALLSAGQMTRIAALIGFILLAVLAVSLVRIAKLNLEAGRLDEETVAVARTVAPGAADAADAELKVAAMLMERGGNGGFSGMMASLMSALRATPTVSLASVNLTAEGSLRVQLAGATSDDINIVLLALQDAGWRIVANAVQQQGGRLLADIVVQR